MLFKTSICALRFKDNPPVDCPSASRRSYCCLTMVDVMRKILFICPPVARSHWVTPHAYKSTCMGGLWAVVSALTLPQGIVFLWSGIITRAIASTAVLEGAAVHWTQPSPAAVFLEVQTHLPPLNILHRVWNLMESDSASVMLALTHPLLIDPMQQKRAFWICKADHYYTFPDFPLAFHRSWPKFGLF